MTMLTSDGRRLTTQYERLTTFYSPCCYQPQHRPDQWLMPPATNGDAIGDNNDLIDGNDPFAYDQPVTWQPKWPKRDVLCQNDPAT